jgi:hypothetical protein
MPEKSVNELLKDRFEAKHVDAMVRHFRNMVSDYQEREWEDANVKAGKFVEATLKVLWRAAGETVPKGKAFKAGNTMDQLGQKTALPDSLRVTIPRACRFIYEIASNRGARHDADEIEANEMDANAVMALSSWVLAELVSNSQKGLDLSEAESIVEAIIRRKYPFVEEIDGRVYVDIAGSAREAALLILWRVYPKRLSEDALFDMLRRHQYKKANASQAINRIQGVVDNDNGNLRLRAFGIKEAEQIIEKARNAP